MNTIQAIGEAVGKGLLAGVAGTAVMTGVQALEMKASGRKPSKTPAKAAEKMLEVEPKNERVEQQIAQGVHWLYGTSWGVARAVLPKLGLRGAAASSVHLALVWGTALTMLPALGLAPPVAKWPKKQLLEDLGMHAVYAFAVGAVADRLERRH